MGLGFVRIKELVEERTGRFEQDFTRTYTRTWQVITNSPYVDSLSVITAPGIPLRNSMYLIFETGVFDRFARVKEINASQPDRDVPTLWHVHVTYSSKRDDPSQQNQSDQETPLQKSGRVQWGWVSGKKLFTQTQETNQKPVVNSAFEPFDPVPEIDDPKLQLTFVRNEASFDPDRAWQYQNTYNSDNFMGWEPRQALLIEYSAYSDFDKDTVFWPTTYRIVFAYPSWDLELPDVGTYAYKNSISPNANPDQLTEEKTATPTDTAGLAVGGKVRLNGNGQLLAAGAKPVYLKFRTHYTTKFADLHIPDMRPRKPFGSKFKP